MSVAVVIYKGTHYNAEAIAEMTLTKWRDHKAAKGLDKDEQKKVHNLCKDALKK